MRATTIRTLIRMELARAHQQLVIPTDKILCQIGPTRASSIAEVVERIKAAIEGERTGGPGRRFAQTLRDIDRQVARLLEGGD